MATWSEAVPVDALLISDIPSTIRDAKIAIETLFEREHVVPGGTIGSGMTGGYHTEGSAKPYCRTTEPTTRLDGSAFTSIDVGSIWIHTDATVANTIYILTAISPRTWTLISTALITTLLAADRTFLEKLKSTKDFSVGSNTMTVAAASGNTTIAGTLVNTGKITADGGITLKSDDSRLIEHVKNPIGAQDAATKAYVDSKYVMGTWTANNSLGAAIDGNLSDGSTNQYKVTSDGFIMAWIDGSYDSSPILRVYMKLNDGSSTQVADINGRYQSTASVMFPVKNGDTFYLNTAGGSGTWHIYWLPIGTGSCVKQ